MSQMIQLPEGVEVDLNYYFKSPSTGLSVAMEMKGIDRLPDDFVALLAPGGRYAADTRANGALPDFATDWRPMTADEIKAYKADQGEEG